MMGRGQGNSSCGEQRVDQIGEFQPEVENPLALMICLVSSSYT
jgi:hypothetical protein